MRISDVVFVYRLSSPELVEWHSRRHAHGADEYELHYFLGGDGRFENGSERYVISHGALFFSGPGQRHSIRPGDMRRPVSYYAVLFALPPEDPLCPILRHIDFSRSFPRLAGSRHRLLFEDLKTTYAHPNSARRRAAQHMLQAFLWNLTADTETRTHAAAPYNVHVTRAMRLFEENLNTNISVTDVARAIGITQAHLTRLFTCHLGVSPLQYYRRLRMDVAASMLLDSTRSVKEISWELGYSNPFHFTRSFTRYADMSPSEYRRQYYRTNPTRYETRMVRVPDGTSSLETN